MGRRKKITWDVIFKDFKFTYPKLARKAIHFEPYDYATILLIFAGGNRRTYNYDTKMLEKIEE